MKRIKKKSSGGLEVDPIPNSQKIKIVCQTVRRITIKILGRKWSKAAERFCFRLNLSMNTSVNKFGKKIPVFKKQNISKKGDFWFQKYSI